MHDPTGLFFAACLYFIVPIAIAKGLLRASWRAILIGYGVWFGGLLLFGLTAGSQAGEWVGWAMILAMFFTIPGLPVVVLLLRLAKIR